jgi:hypothetical protein
MAQTEALGRNFEIRVGDFLSEIAGKEGPHNPARIPRVRVEIWKSRPEGDPMRSFAVLKMSPGFREH